MPLPQENRRDDAHGKSSIGAEEECLSMSTHAYREGKWGEERTRMNTFCNTCTLNTQWVTVPPEADGSLGIPTCTINV